MDTEITQAPRRVDIRHVGDFDVVLNLANIESSQDSLLIKVVDGLQPPPPNKVWQLLPIIKFQAYRDNIFVDDLEHPSYLLKRRWITSDKGSFLNSIRYPKNYRKSQNYRYGSVSNEISLSNEISKMISHPDIQRIVKEFGYNGVSFVEPILAAIDKRSLKNMCYINILMQSQ